MVLYALWNPVELQWFETETVLELIWAGFGLHWSPESESEVVIEIVSHLTPQEASLLGCDPQPEMVMVLDVCLVVQRAVWGFGIQAEVDPAPAPGAGIAGLEFHWIPYEDAQVQAEVEEVTAVPALSRTFGLSGVVQELLSSQLHSLLLLQPCQ